MNIKSISKSVFQYFIAGILGILFVFLIFDFSYDKLKPFSITSGTILFMLSWWRIKNKKVKGRITHFIFEFLDELLINKILGLLGLLPCIFGAAALFSLLGEHFYNENGAAYGAVVGIFVGLIPGFYCARWLLRKFTNKDV